MNLVGSDATKRKGVSRLVKDASYGLHRKLANSFYRHPTTQQDWGDEQSHETNWADLFFDLVFVAIFVQLGNQLVADLDQADDIRSPYVARGLIFFFVLYVIATDVWADKTSLRARFQLDSIYHKLLDLCQSAVVAVFGMHITSVDSLIDENGYNFLFGLVLAVLVYEMLVYSTYVEVIAYSKQETAVRMSRLMLCDMGVSVLPLVAALFTTSYAFDWRITLALIGLHPVLRRAPVMYRTFWAGGYRRGSMVPINVAYVAERGGEYTMLNIGEGVLQLTITALNEDHVGAHFVTFFASFFVLGLIQLLHYRLTPMDPDDHAFRKSGRRGIMLLQITIVSNMAISITGVGLKSNLKNIEKTSKPEYQVFTFVLCAALATSMVFMILAKLMHVGPYEIVLNTPAKYLKRRLAYWVARTTLPGLYLIIPGAALKGYYNAAACLLITSLLVFVNVGDERQADEYRSAEFDLDLERRSVGDLERDLRRLSMMRPGSGPTATTAAATAIATPAASADDDLPNEVTN